MSVLAIAWSDSTGRTSRGQIAPYSRPPPHRTLDQSKRAARSGRGTWAPMRFSCRCSERNRTHPARASRELSTTLPDSAAATQSASCCLVSVQRRTHGGARGKEGSGLGRARARR
eukprot:991323-Rhodomonas_salina.1